MPEDEAAETVAGVRKRDEERFAIQMAEGIYAGRDLMVKQREPTPTPLSPPKRAAQPLSEETAVVAAEDEGESVPADREPAHG